MKLRNRAWLDRSTKNH